MKKFREHVPKLSSSLHKGQCGRIGIVGGSALYTGAPFYAGMTAMRLGVDLVHIFCEHEAAVPIKCYAPELIVHPTMHVPEEEGGLEDWIDRMHAVLIGPGAGRNLKNIEAMRRSVHLARQTDIPVVVDADGLFAIQAVLQDPEYVQGNKKVVLTPNVAEFKRLCDKLLGQDEEKQSQAATKVANVLGNVTIVLKGEHDIITNGLETVKSERTGSVRRSGGQGDILSGAITTFLAWADINHSTDYIFACLAACEIVKLASSKAYEEHGRSMIASDVIHKIPAAFTSEEQKQ